MHERSMSGAGGEEEIVATRDSRLVELANLASDDTTLEYMVHMAKGEDSGIYAGNTLSNRERFRTNPLWIDVDAAPSSRLNTGYSMGLPRHAHEMKVQHGVNDFRGHRNHDVSPAQKRSNINSERGTFMASSPMNDSEEAGSFHESLLERQGRFMRASCKHAPKHSQNSSPTTKGITVKSMAYTM
jgi:hypothetical protein